MRYESADIRQTGAIDYVCDLCSIPVEDSRYDLVISTQAFYNMADPLAALTEMRRLLKGGGCLWLSTPFYYVEMSPHDFYRYTQFGLRHVLTVAGFEVLELGWVEGYCGMASYQLSTLADGLPRSSGDYGGGALGTLVAMAVLAARPLIRLLALILAHADQRHRFTAAGHCLNYYVVAQKRPS
jgi:SAM-dependent methyltransferase